MYSNKFNNTQLELFKLMSLVNLIVETFLIENFFNISCKQKKKNLITHTKKRIRV